MLGWTGHMEKMTTANANFRAVLFTGKFAQLTVMSLKPGEEIGLEVHEHVDQFIRIEQGRARVTLSKNRNSVEEQHLLEEDWAIVIPAGLWHNVINDGDGELKLYSIYSPPEHPDGTVHVTKAEADAAEAAHGH